MSTESTSQSPKQSAKMSKMTAFFKSMPKAPEPDMIHWKTTTAVEGTTARLEVPVKARIGSFFVMHAVAAGAPEQRPRRAAAAAANVAMDVLEQRGELE